MSAHGPPASRPGRRRAGAAGRRRASLAAHVEHHGRVPRPAAAGAGADRRGRAQRACAGRGGAGFPTRRKLRAVAGRRAAPSWSPTAPRASRPAHKDALLMRTPRTWCSTAPCAAARSAPARSSCRRRAERGARARRSAAAIAERSGRRGRDRFELVAVPDRLRRRRGVGARALAERRARRSRRSCRRGRSSAASRGRPTLVQNVETLAHIALIARYGAAWFRARRHAERAGHHALTVGGAVAPPRRRSRSSSARRSRDVLDAAGGPAGRRRRVLVGGYFGTWLPRRGPRRSARDAGLRPLGASLGRGRRSPSSRVPRAAIVETARVAALARRRERRPVRPVRLRPARDRRRVAALAAATRGAARPLGAASGARRRSTAAARARHPDGAARLVESALRSFADEIEPPPRRPLHGRHPPPRSADPARREGWR